MKKLYLGFVRDHSGSMSGLRTPAMTDFNVLIEQYTKESISHMFFTQVSTIECGVPIEQFNWKNPGYGNKMVDNLLPIPFVKPLTSYTAMGNTPLYDAISMLIDHFESVPDAREPHVQFMIMVLTDGEENASKTKEDILRSKIERVQKTGDWTIALRVPYGYGKNLVSRLGIHSGNVFEWDGTSAKSYAESTTRSVEATQSYFKAASLGAKSTDKFYTNLENVSIDTIKANVVDISSQVKVFTTTGPEVIKPFLERMTGSFIKGTAYYQLTKTEDVVQDYKGILIVYKKTGATYAGRDARQILGLPTTGNCKVAPGNHGDYEIYIQSTSINRKLPGGTKLIVWDPLNLSNKNSNSVAPIVSNPATTQKSTATRVPTSTTEVGVQAIKDEQFKVAYRIGYKDGKSHKSKVPFPTIGYIQGYKDGRNKNPALY